MFRGDRYLDDCKSVIYRQHVPRRVQSVTKKIFPEDLLKMDSNQKRDNNLCSKLLDRRIILIEDLKTTESINSIIAQLLFLEIEDSKKDIYLYINSSGGAVSGGLAIYDMMQNIEAHVVTVCIDLAAGMAGLLLASGTKGKRICFSDSEIVLTSSKLGRTKISPLVLAELNYCHRKINGTLSKHTGQTTAKIEKDTIEDFHFTPQEAKEYGLVDIIMERNNPTIAEVLKTLQSKA